MLDVNIELDESTATASGLTAGQFMDMLDAHLAGRSFIAADQFSIADITAVVAIDFARVVRIKPGEQHVNLLRWREEMAKRPSFSR